jgi:threonylcarbamoyladenosine tRNA methylthiotransferase MtaB
MKVYLDMVGCRLNQAEIEQYARQFRAAGHILVARPQDADLAVINTCTVTAAAESDSRQKVRQIARAGVSKLALTGCWVTLNPAEAASLHSVNRIVLNQFKDSLVSEILQELQSFDAEPIERSAIPGLRFRTRAFIKAQDGCDNHCTFCITTAARGAGRSRSIAEIIKNIRLDTGQGPGDNDYTESPAREVVLTGVHLGSWGNDLPHNPGLRDLVRAILDETDVPRLRLSSLEPWDLDESFFQLWEDPRLCKHLHLPLQSGCAATLKRMARKTTPQKFSDLVITARAQIPEIAVTTDIITGFPGETDDEFNQSLEFVRSLQFADGHVFTYSARPGTAAAAFSGQVPFMTRKQRNHEMRAILEASSLDYRQKFIGQRLPVLWENATALGPEGWELSGLTGNYLRVNATSSSQRWNTIIPVQITGLTPEGVYGLI